VRLIKDNVWERDTHIPAVDMLLYAQAAAGPEYEYPAWLVDPTQEQRRDRSENIRCDDRFAPWDGRRIVVLVSRFNVSQPVREFRIEGIACYLKKTCNA
jgi:hypothetical protein